MGIGGFWRERVLPWLESLFAWLGYSFVNRWGALERGYRRPLARVALRLKFAFYPLLACAALAWLGWDWTHERSLDAAEDAIFDQVVRWRPLEPRLSGRTLVVEIDASLADTAAFCEAYGVPLEKSVNAAVVKGARAGVELD